MEEPWVILGIDPTDDMKTIKKAYAAQLRECHPEDHPVEFQQLRQAYETILDELKLAASRPVFRSESKDDNDDGHEDPGESDIREDGPRPDGTEPVGNSGNNASVLAEEFMDKVYSIYEDYSRRIDLSTWQDLFEDEKYWPVNVRRITHTSMIYYLTEDMQLPHNVWKYLNRHLMLLDQYDELERYCSNRAIKRLTALINIKNELSYDIFDPDGSEIDFGLYINQRDNAFFSLAYGDLERAEIYLNAAYDLFSGDEDLKRLLVIYLLKKGEPDQAFDVFRESYSTEFNKETFEQLNSYVCEYDQIASHLEKENILCVIILNKLISLLKTGKMDPARNKACELLHYCDGITWYIDREQITNALYMMKKYEEVLELCDEILSTDSENETALSKKALSLHSLGRYAETLELYDRILELFPDHPDIGGMWHNKALALIFLEMYTEALIHLDKAIALNESFPENWAKKGEVLFRLEQFQPALDCLDLALELNPGNATAWNFKAMSLHELKRHSEALSCFDQALAINPLFDGAWHEKGNVLYYLERYEEALVCYDRAISLDHGENAYWINKGIVLDCMEHYEEALECFEVASAKEPLYSRAWNLKGQILVKLDRYEEALLFFDKAISIDHNHCLFWRNKANALDKLQQYEEALECFDMALAIDPGDDRGWYLKGLLLEKLGNYEEALSCLEQAIGLKKNIEYLGNKGCLLHDIGRYEEALACYDLGLEIDPSERSLLFNKCMVLIRKNRYTEALECCEKGISFYEDDGRFWSRRGRILDQLKQSDKAIASYARALEIDPHNEYNWNSRGLIALRTRKYKEALLCFEKAVLNDKRGNMVIFRTNMGNALHMLELFDEALECYDEVLKLDPEQDNAWSGKGEVFLESGDYRAAIDCCEQAIHIDPENDEAWECKGKALQKLKRWEEAKECLARRKRLKLCGKQHGKK